MMIRDACNQDNVDHRDLLLPFQDDSFDFGVAFSASTLDIFLQLGPKIKQIYAFSSGVSKDIDSAKERERE